MKKSKLSLSFLMRCIAPSVCLKFLALVFDYEICFNPGAGLVRVLRAMRRLPPFLNFLTLCHDLLDVGYLVA